MSSHYYSKTPASSGKRTLIQTFQLGNQLSFSSQSGVFGWRKVDVGSELLLNNAKIPAKNATILDLGCGYGFLGIAIAKAYPEIMIYMVDVNELAVKLTKANCKKNGVLNNTTVLQGNLYEPLKGLKFNTIITNPPLMAGKKILKMIISQAPKYLEKSGTLQLVAPKKKGLKSIQKMIEDTFTTYEVLGKGSGFWVLSAKKE
ncbi:MAG: class I SAM-dependent methyltransferase [Asgard group archaeon]|nr:class I SAM-dependent methyltransferase [Asgard group archaeon]